MGRGGRKERAGRHTSVQAMQHGSLMCREKKKEKRREADECKNDLKLGVSGGFSENMICEGTEI